jgi:hypothetical protein
MGRKHRHRRRHHGVLAEAAVRRVYSTHRGAHTLVHSDQLPGPPVNGILAAMCGTLGCPAGVAADDAWRGERCAKATGRPGRVRRLLTRLTTHGGITGADPDPVAGCSDHLPVTGHGGPHTSTRRHQVRVHVARPCPRCTDQVAVRILVRTATARGLLLIHHDDAGRCAGCVHPTPWPCELARLCHEATGPHTRWSRWVCRALRRCCGGGDHAVIQTNPKRDSGLDHA